MSSSRSPPLRQARSPAPPALDGEPLGVRRHGAAEQAEEHRIAGMECGGLRERAGIGVGAGNAEADLHPEIGVGPGAAQARHHGLRQALQLHHGVAAQVGDGRRQVEEVAASRGVFLRSSFRTRRQEAAVQQRLLDGPGRAGRIGERDGRDVAAPQRDLGNTRAGDTRAGDTRAGDRAVVEADAPDAALWRRAPRPLP